MNKKTRFLILLVVLGLGLSGIISAQTLPPAPLSQSSQSSTVLPVTDTAAKVEEASDIKNEEPPKPEEKIVTIAVPELGYTREFERKKISPQIFDDSMMGLSAAYRPANTTVNSGETETATEYLELRGLVGEIRHRLLLEGYHVVEAGSGMVVHGQDEKAQIFDIKRRISRGEFNGATFVLVGTLVDISPISSVTQILGTDGVLQRRGLDLLVDFSLIDTKTLQITAAFNAHGEASEMRLDRVNRNSNPGDFVPRRAKMIKDLAVSLAKNVSKRLEAHGYFPEREAELTPEDISKQKYNRYEDKNLKVYKN